MQFSGLKTTANVYNSNKNKENKGGAGTRQRSPAAAVAAAHRDVGAADWLPCLFAFFPQCNPVSAGKQNGERAALGEDEPLVISKIKTNKHIYDRASRDGAAELLAENGSAARRWGDAHYRSRPIVFNI